MTAILSLYRLGDRPSQLSLSASVLSILCFDVLQIYPPFVNTQQLRKSLRQKWLEYYRDNRPWITRLRVWSNVDGVRRPSSGFILASLAALEPNLNQLLPLIVDLTADPDRIIKALGLDFNPDEVTNELPQAPTEQNPKLLPETTQASIAEKALQRPPKPAIADEVCQGTKPMSQSAGRDWH